MQVASNSISAKKKLHVCALKEYYTVFLHVLTMSDANVKIYRISLSSSLPKLKRICL